MTSTTHHTVGTFRHLWSQRNYRFSRVFFRKSTGKRRPSRRFCHERTKSPAGEFFRIARFCFFLQPRPHIVWLFTRLTSYWAFYIIKEQYLIIIIVSTIASLVLLNHLEIGNNTPRLPNLVLFFQIPPIMSIQTTKTTKINYPDGSDSPHHVHTNDKPKSTIRTGAKPRFKSRSLAPADYQLSFLCTRLPRRNNDATDHDDAPLAPLPKIHNNQTE